MTVQNDVNVHMSVTFPLSVRSTGNTWASENLVNVLFADCLDKRIPLSWMDHKRQINRKMVKIRAAQTKVS